MLKENHTKIILLPGTLGSDRFSGILHWSTWSFSAFTSSMSPGTLKTRHLHWVATRGSCTLTDSTDTQLKMLSFCLHHVCLVMCSLCDCFSFQNTLSSKVPMQKKEFHSMFDGKEQISKQVEKLQSQACWRTPYTNTQLRGSHMLLGLSWNVNTYHEVSN